MMYWKNIVIVLFCMFLFILKVFSQPQEYSVKAVFIERFTQFIDWPKEVLSETAPPFFIIGVIGENPFGNELENLYNSKLIKNKNVKILYLNSASEIDLCHVLFISSSKKNEILSILNLTSFKPILTIGDTTGFCEKGVLINFFVENSKIRFAINNTAFQNAGLTVSYHLLKYAKVISNKGNK